MKLKLLARHFKGTKFDNRSCCAIEKAIEEKIGDRYYIREGISFVMVGSKDFKHPDYHVSDFRKDKKVAKTTKYDNTLVREINIPKLKLKDLK